MTAVVAIVVVCAAFAALCAWIKRSPTTADPEERP